MSPAGRYEARRLPQDVRSSSLELWGVWRGGDWLPLPGPDQGPAWFVTKELAQREADRHNTGSWGLLVPEQAPERIAESIDQASELVDPHVAVSVLNTADRLVVDSGELFERKLGQPSGRA